jgi:uncharacterized damage-inducible protein DinB
MSDLITDFVRQNEWANVRLIDACRDLTDDQPAATVDGTFGSIRDTFMHIISSEGWYAFRLGHEPAVRTEKGDWAGFDALAAAASSAADSLIEAAHGSADQRIAGEEHDFDAAVVIVQAVHHGTDHRSQICTVLTTLGIEPPDLSSWGWGLASGRMQRR